MGKIIVLTESQLKNVINRVITEESRVLLNENQNLSCVVNPGLNPTRDDGTNKVFQKYIKTVDGVNNDTAQNFGSNGGWTWAVPSGTITGTWGCKAGGGFYININGGAGGMGSVLPIVYKSSDQYHYDSSRNQDSFNTNAWLSGPYKDPQAKAAVQSKTTTTTTKTPAQTTNKTTKTTKTQTPTKKTKSRVKYVKPDEINDVKAFQDWLDSNKSDVELGKGNGWAWGFKDGKLRGGKGYGTYGPRSNAAWEKYGNEYGKTKSLELSSDVQNKMNTQNDLLWSSGADIQGNKITPVNPVNPVNPLNPENPIVLNRTTNQ